MSNLLLRVFVKLCLWFRYRITVKGVEKIVAKGTEGILFLPNHPALIDPVIVASHLNKWFRPRPLADDKQVQGTPLRYIQNVIRVLPLPDLGIAGRGGVEAVKAQINNCVTALKAGDNLLFYPAGHLYRSKYEKLHGNGGVKLILEQYPDVRIVLVRTVGLWGSSFSRSIGFQSPFGEILKAHLKHLLGNFLFFSPRRRVSVELVEAEDFPRTEPKDVINRWLEKFYNADARPNTYVPYYFWERGKTREVPEPESVNVVIDTKDVPDSVRKTVYAKLHEMTSHKQIKEGDLLGTDLGMDSLMITELQVWIQEEFGQQVNNPESLRTVGSVLLAAIGQSDGVQPLKPVPENWLQPENPTVMSVRPGDKITDIFLQNAAERPDFPLIADQLKGVCTHRQMILAIMVLKKCFEKIPGERVGLIMPACLTVNIVYMALLFANKVPVMINWTVGLRNMKHCLQNAGVETIVTSLTVIQSLEGRGTDFGELKGQFRYLEEMVKEVSLVSKLRCKLASLFCWHSLRAAKVQDICAILFTSGSENLPKAVPILHTNILEDVRAALDHFELRLDDIAIGMLPPFHSFGLLINIVMPNCAGMRVVYHTNPLEGDMIARLVAAYNATMTIGTPSFVHNILRNAQLEQVKTIRVAITGAEKCPKATYDLIQAKCPNARLDEGYGITECAPIVCLNKPNAVKIGSLGKVLCCMKWTVRDENMQEVPPNTTGMLYVSGPNVFPGYLNYDGPSPFVEIDGEMYYRTGDLVQADEEGFIFFKGRLKRFVKVAGEMVSLPAIEEVLMKAYRDPEGDLPLAVEARGTEENPVITLFTILDLTREEVNQKIREAGLSPIHSIKEIVKLEAIPVLGTGKTDYRSLKTLA